MSDIKYQISSIKYQVSVVKYQLSSIKLQVSHCKYQDARGIKREQVIAILKLFCYLLTHLLTTITSPRGAFAPKNDAQRHIRPL